MKDRPKGFLKSDVLSHDSELFDYIRELHNYLWRFVSVAYPDAAGNLCDFVDVAIEKLEGISADEDIVVVPAMKTIAIHGKEYEPGYPLCAGCPHLTLGGGWHCCYKPNTSECAYPDKLIAKSIA